MNTIQEEVLEELGDTSDKIASKLKEIGIKGKPSEACKCAIAKFLLSKGFTKVSVDKDDIAVCCEGVEIWCETPYQVACFIEEFDMYKHPELIG